MLLSRNENTGYLFLYRIWFLEKMNILPKNPIQKTGNERY